MRGHAKKGKIVHGSKLEEVLREKIRSAIARQAIETSEAAEFYLVSLLSDFKRTEHLFERYGPEGVEKPFAIMLMEAMGAGTKEKIRCLKKVGDITLIITGFFADNIHSSILDSSYYISIGGTAYSSLAVSLAGHEAFVELYREMSSKFSEFADVIGAVAPWNRAFSNIELLRIYERWLTTGDERLRALLQRQGILLGDRYPKEKLQ